MTQPAPFIPRKLRDTGNRTGSDLKLAAQPNKPTDKSEKKIIIVLNYRV